MPERCGSPHPAPSSPCWPRSRSATPPRPDAAHRPPQRDRPPTGLDAATGPWQGEAGADDAYASALDRWLAVGAADIDARLGGVLAEVGLPEPVVDQPTSTLSGGQAARLELAGVLLTRADVLLLDEPTNDLDFEGLDRLERFARDQSGAVVVVSHDRAFLERTVTGVVELDDHTRTARSYAGGWLAYLDERATDRVHAEEAYATYASSRDELRGRAQQVREWSTQGTARVRRSGETDKHIRHHRTQTSEKLAGKAARADRALARLEEVDKPFEGWELRLELAVAERGGAVAAALEGAVVERSDPGGGPGFRLGPVDVEVRSGDRIALVGPNGAGKTTLVEALLGRVPLASGTGRVGPSVVVGEVAQARTAFDAAPTLLDAVLAATGMTLAEARSLLAKLGLGADDVGRSSASLSPGERTPGLARPAHGGGHQLAGARRADQPPRPGRHRAAGGGAGHLDRHAAGGQPRPALPRRGGHRGHPAHRGARRPGARGPLSPGTGGAARGRLRVRGAAPASPPRW